MPRRLSGSGTRPVLATYDFRNLDTNQISVAHVVVGPDSGLFYLASQPPLNGADIYFHPDLKPGTTFYAKQTGSPSGTCGQSDMPVLWNEIRRHEGRTQASNSHYGVTNMALLDLRPDMAQEGRYETYPGYSEAGGVTAMRLDIQYALYEWKTSAHYARQAAFDSTDYPLVQQTLGCLLNTSP